MAFKVSDRTQETSTSTGSGPFTLNGAVAGLQTFAVGIGDGISTYYTVTDDVNWMDVYGTYTISTNSLSVDTVLSSSNGGTTPVSFAAGTKTLFCTYPASKAVIQDINGTIWPTTPVVVIQQTSGVLNVNITTGNQIILCDCTNNTITLNLPSAIGYTGTLTIKKINTSTNVVNVVPSGTQTIDTYLILTMTETNSSLDLISNGSNWFIT